MMKKNINLSLKFLLAFLVCFALNIENSYAQYNEVDDSDDTTAEKCDGKCPEYVPEGSVSNLDAFFTTANYYAMEHKAYINNLKNSIQKDIENKFGLSFEHYNHAINTLFTSHEALYYPNEISYSQSANTAKDKVQNHIDNIRNLDIRKYQLDNGLNPLPNMLYLELGPTAVDHAIGTNALNYKLQEENYRIYKSTYNYATNNRDAALNTAVKLKVENQFNHLDELNQSYLVALILTFPTHAYISEHSIMFSNELNFEENYDRRILNYFNSSFIQNHIEDYGNTHYDSSIPSAPRFVNDRTLRALFIDQFNYELSETDLSYLSYYPELKKSIDLYFGNTLSRSLRQSFLDVNNLFYEHEVLLTNEGECAKTGESDNCIDDGLLAHLIFGQELSEEAIPYKNTNSSGIGETVLRYSFGPFERSNIDIQGLTRIINEFINTTGNSPYEGYLISKLFEGNSIQVPSGLSYGILAANFSFFITHDKFGVTFTGNNDTNLWHAGIEIEDFLRNLAADAIKNEIRDNLDNLLSTDIVTGYPDFRMTSIDENWLLANPTYIDTLLKFIETIHADQIYVKDIIEAWRNGWDIDLDEFLENLKETERVDCDKGQTKDSQGNCVPCAEKDPAGNCSKITWVQDTDNDNYYLAGSMRREYPNWSAAYAYKKISVTLGIDCDDTKPELTTNCCTEATVCNSGETFDLEKCKCVKPNCVTKTGLSHVGNFTGTVTVGENTQTKTDNFRNEDGTNTDVNCGSGKIDSGSTVTILDTTPVKVKRQTGTDSNGNPIFATTESSYYKVEYEDCEKGNNSDSPNYDSSKPCSDCTHGDPIKDIQILESSGSGIKGGLFSKDARKYANGNPKAHNGYDIDMESGTEVASMFDGKVIQIQTNHADLGKWIIVESTVGGEKVQMWYAHLSKIDVTVNQIISQSSILGESGKSGNAGNPGSAGPHLHLAAREIVNGKWKKVDPGKFLSSDIDKTTGKGTSPCNN